jgi:uncharacterized membrane protein YraQ (UPF0718 family)
MHVHSYPPAEDDPECCHEHAVKKSMSLMQKTVELFRFAFVELLGDIWKWLIAGVLIGGLISYLAPESLIQKYLGGGFQSMLVMLVVGIPMYVCATGSIPIAAALMFKGMSPGAALVFLLAGPATNAVTITVVSKMLGRGATVIYLACISVASVAMGYLLDYIIRAKPVISEGAGMEMLPGWVEAASSVVLLVLILFAIARWIRSKKRCKCGHDLVEKK